METLLAIGTVVKLKKDIVAKIMVVGHSIVNKRDGQIYQYAGVLVPEGIPETNSFLLFNHKDVDGILFSVYSEDAEE